MGRLRKLTMLMGAGIFLPLLFAGCFTKTVKDVNSIRFGSETITAGNYFHLTPVKGDQITLSGKEISVNDFVFHSTLLSKETDIEYKGTVTFPSSYSSGATVTETQSAGNFEKWPIGIAQKDITIRFAVGPMDSYSGYGFLYFYLTDKEGQCISNIIMWKVKFV